MFLQGEIHILETFVFPFSRITIDLSLPVHANAAEPLPTTSHACQGNNFK